MTRNWKISLASITMLLSVATMSAAAADTVAAAPTAAPAKTDGAVTPAEPAQKPNDATVRLKVPLLSPLFAKVPVASVNDEQITVEDLTVALGSVHEGMGGEMGKAKPAEKQDVSQLLNRLITARLIVQEGVNIGLDKQDDVKKPLDDFSETTLRETLLNELAKDAKPDAKELEKVYRSRAREWKLKALLFKKPGFVEEAKKSLREGQSFDELFKRAIADGTATVAANENAYEKADTLTPGVFDILSPMKAGEISTFVPTEKGWVLFKVLDVHSFEDPKIKETIEKQMMVQARLQALEDSTDALIKKYVKKKEKLIAKLDFESAKPGFKALLKDKRVIAQIQGEKDLTVADYAKAYEEKYFHGVERAIAGKKLNKEKKNILREMLTSRILKKEAKARGLDSNEEYVRKVQAFRNQLVFGTFIKKVIFNDIKITVDELKAYYKDHQKDFTTEEAYRLEAISLKTPQEAQAAVDKLRAGMDFKWYQANAEGHLEPERELKDFFMGQPVVKSILPDSIQKALTGSLSNEYRTASGKEQSYAIHVIEFQPVETKSFEVAQGFVQQAVFNEKMTKAVEEWSEKLKAASDVKIYAEFAK